MKDILTNKKNIKVFGIAALVTLIVLSSFSYAYFIGSIGGSASTDVDVTTSVNERLVFTEGNPIGIHATLDNFSEGDGSLTGETTTNVKLNAGSASSTATELYQVYFDITANDFEYSVNNTTPELVLTITDPEGNTLTEATLPDGTTINTKTVTTLVQDGLGGTTSQSVVGFDVTEITGIIKLYEDYEITNANPTVATEQNWTAKITFINLDAEQTVNEGKTFNANFLLQQDKLTAGNKMISGPEFAALTSEYRMTMSDPNNPEPPSKELNKIIFNDTINSEAYTAATDKWDVSEAGDGSVVAYLVTENTNEVMYIEANGKIVANEILGAAGQTGFVSLFGLLSSVTEINFGNVFDTSNVIDMTGLFIGTNLSSLDLSNFKTDKVTNMSAMFAMSSLPSIDLSLFNTINVTNMSAMFASARSLTNLNLESFDTTKVTTMQGMFSGMDSLTSLNISTFNTSNVTDMSVMFERVSSLTSLNLNFFDTTKVTSMEGMFKDMSSLTSLNISTFNTSNVTNMSLMFQYMNLITSLDLSSFDTNNVTKMNNMFYFSPLLSSPLYAKTQADADKFNNRATTNLISSAAFTVKP